MQWWWLRDRSQPSARPEQVALVLDELRRRTEELSRRSESMSARCGMLIASAALVATLQQGRAVDGWLAAGVLLSLTAAVIGVCAIYPRKIRYPEIEETRAELYRRGYIADAQWWLVDRLTEQYVDAREFLKVRGHLLRWGFVLLGLSIIASAGSVVSEFVVGGDFVGKDLDPSQVPAVVPSQGGSSEYVEHGDSRPGETAFFGAATERF